MDRDPYADMFRFQLGAHVRWAEDPTKRYYVGQRRWTEREILEPLVTYRLRGRDKDGIFMDWVREQDLIAWQDE